MIVIFPFLMLNIVLSIYFHNFECLTLDVAGPAGGCFRVWMRAPSSCVADNALGRTKKYIEISGRPGPAEFISPTFSGSLEVYNLTWSVESIPPLEEIRLLYRRLMVSQLKYKITHHPPLRPHPTSPPACSTHRNKSNNNSRSVRRE